MIKKVVSSCLAIILSVSAIVGCANNSVIDSNSNYERFNGNMNDVFLETIKLYFSSIYKADYDAIGEIIYPEDADEFKSVMIKAAEAMIPFGETDRFYELFDNVTSIEDLQSIPPTQFIGKYLSGMMGRLSEDKASAFLGSIKIEDIKKDKNKATVSFSYVLEHDDEKIKIDREMNLKKKNGNWYVLLYSGLSNFGIKIQKEIELFPETLL
ncbi:MAG: hypothetical protein GY795_39920 [Desulfobacterales bacterium]|nr:hypothetical protein [Desulfobacterales bacterium]